MTTSSKSLPALLAQTSLDDHEEILKAANAAIKKSKADIDAHHAKAVALLKLDRYDDAVKIFTDTPQLQERTPFEYAYALYKSGEASQAVEVAQRDSSSRAMKHVLAQAAYRSENFEQAAAVYRQLSSDRHADEEADIKINWSAVDAQLEWSGKGHLAQTKKAGRDDLQAFETAYNTACGCISRDELQQAEICLKRAKEDLCNAAEDLTEEEKKVEIMPMTVQEVYVLTRLGRIEEAEQLSTTIPFAEIRELSTRYIAQINSIAASTKHTNPYLSQRLMHSAPKPPKTDRPFTFQSDILRQDEYVIDLMTHKVAGVISHTSKLISSSPAPTTSPSINTASVFNAAAQAQNLSEKAALKAILPLLEKRPNDIGLLLTITQLYVLTHNLAAATQLLESFFKRLEQSGSASDLDIRHAPGLIAVLVSLYVRQGRHSHSKSGLAKAASYWRRKSETAPRSLMVAAGSALLETHNADSIAMAGEIFESLHERDRADRAAIAGLVAAYAVADPAKIAPDLVDVLPPVERLVSGIDVSALENAGVPGLPLSSAAAAVPTKRPAPGGGRQEEGAPVKKTKRIRKARMPKDFMPGRSMDPERWLPMRDRTYYRPKGKKGKKKMDGLTQGGAVAEDRAAGTVGGQKKGGGKKKGKGGKW
ncbi:signal recognition particle protein-like protein [Westerdykella ornata]|uniref:Signal recognition particle subunit SRP72 n=1 Tax=Westerdykella ornata TaxID=318751 RepID=A0A6A6JN85_WESOR|nr:signal recognition particle protein-like protein [Westerdykella ornata]KAF2277972.1 signal recognition particle protein-like protein [Westerdykella ornata]